jgi:hypothetical protein
MLVIISDLHLGDGTTSASIPASAFRLFTRRLRETAQSASERSDGFRPIDSLDVVLMGDVIDPLHSTRWLEASPGGEAVRPWSDPYGPHFAPMLLRVTRAILRNNREACEVLRACARGELVYVTPDERSTERIPVRVAFHYMVGNHDWYYRLPGAAFDVIRREIIDGMGLRNPPSPFPHEPEESAALYDLFWRYRIVARHGDRYDLFNFHREKGRNAATLGDAFTMDVCNRFPVEVRRRHGDDVPPDLVDSLRAITNIRPPLATPLWISGQISLHAGSPALEKDLKQIWDRIADEFLELEFVRHSDQRFRIDVVKAMGMIVKVTRHMSFDTLRGILNWVRSHLWEVKHSFADHALNEPAFQQRSARYFVYGHTHQHEVVPLDTDMTLLNRGSQFYFNSGTWHSYFDLAVSDPDAQKFVRYEGLTYLVFYAREEGSGRRFEAWSGVYA